MSYDMIDRFLRNNLGDDDYAEYSSALDALCTPQPKEPEQEPYFKFRECEDSQAGQSPPQRTWVGLTDVEWMNIVNANYAWRGHHPEDVAEEVAKLVEAKLKEKNSIKE